MLLDAQLFRPAPFRMSRLNPPQNRLSKNPSSPTPIADQFKINQSLDLLPSRPAPAPPLNTSSTPNTRSTTPTAQRQRNSYLTKSPPTASKMSQNTYQQPYYSGSSGGPTPGGPPPRPSRQNTSNLQDVFASSHPQPSSLPSRRLSSPPTSSDQYTLSLDPGDSPPPSAINGAGGPRSRSGTGTVKNKKGMLSFMSGASLTVPASTLSPDPNAHPPLAYPSFILYLHFCFISRFPHDTKANRDQHSLRSRPSHSCRLQLIYWRVHRSAKGVAAAPSGIWHLAI